MSLRLALRLFVAVLLPLAAGAEAETQAPVWEEVQVETPVEGVAGVRETRWQATRAPGAPHDRIALHRYRSGEGSRATLLYLPGTNMNGVLTATDERHDLWLYLAARGVDVYALDYRTHFVSNDDPPDPADTPDPGVHAFMLDWTLDLFAADVQAAAAFARKQSGREALFVAGFSRGVTYAYAFACTDPGPVAGLIALDAAFKKHERAETFDFSAAREALIAEDRYANDVAGRMGWQTRQALMSAVARDPASPAQREGFTSAGEQVSEVLYKAWGPGALANPKEGMSRPQILARLLVGYDRWWPAIQNIEGESIAAHTDDPRTALDDRFGELALPILYFGATGLGPTWILDGVYSSVKSGSPDVSVHVLEGYGHLDVLVGERAEQDVFEPTAAWIAERATP